MELNYQKIHIRIFQRTNRKYITIIQNTEQLDTDDKTLLKKFKSILCCNGHIKDHKEYGNVIQLQGDKRQDLRDILVKEYKINPESIELHGY